MRRQRRKNNPKGTIIILQEIDFLFYPDAVFFVPEAVFYLVPFAFSRLLFFLSRGMLVGVREQAEKWNVALIAAMVPLLATLTRADGRMDGLFLACLPSSRGLNCCVPPDEVHSAVFVKIARIAHPLNPH